MQNGSFRGVATVAFATTRTDYDTGHDSWFATINHNKNRGPLPEGRGPRPVLCSSTNSAISDQALPDSFSRSAASCSSLASDPPRGAEAAPSAAGSEPVSLDDDSEE